jgi:hypothetical protein
MKPAPFAFPLLCICSLLLPQAASSQDFSSIGSDLGELENLIHDTLENSRELTQGTPGFSLGGKGSMLEI